MWLWRMILWCFIISGTVTYCGTAAHAKLTLPDGYESSLNDGIETVNKAAEVFKSVLTGTIAALVIIGFVFAILLRAVPSREWKEKGKALLFDNVGTILLVLVGLPALLSVLKLVDL